MSGMMILQPGKGTETGPLKDCDRDRSKKKMKKSVILLTILFTVTIAAGAFALEIMQEDSAATANREAVNAVSMRPGRPSDTAMLGNRTLRLVYPHMRGTDIRAMQKCLKRLGFNCGAANGIFGEKTRDSVKAFQRRYSLTADGVFGRRTRAILLAEYNLRYGYGY